MLRDGGVKHLVGDPWSQTASSPEVEDRKEKNPNHLRKDVFIYLSASVTVFNCVEGWKDAAEVPSLAFGAGLSTQIM